MRLPGAPEARTDLTALVKQRIEQIAVAFSVPSALVSEGSRFAQHASTQLWSFNARVSSLSHHLGTLLTQVYQHLTGDDTAMLVVTPRPLRSIAELLDVHKAKTLTRTTLTPLVMAELGIGTEDAIEAELKRQEEEAAAEEGAAAQAAAAGRCVAAIVGTVGGLFSRTTQDARKGGAQVGGVVSHRERQVSRTIVATVCVCVCVCVCDNITIVLIVSM